MLCVILLFLSVHVEYVVFTNITVRSPEPLFWFLVIWTQCVCWESIVVWVHDMMLFIIRFSQSFRVWSIKRIKSTFLCYNRCWKCCAYTCLHSYYDLSELQFTQSSSWRNSKISLYMSCHTTSVWGFMLQTCSFKLHFK